MTTPRKSKESAIDAERLELRRLFRLGTTLDEAQEFLRDKRGKGGGFNRQKLAAFRREALRDTIRGAERRSVVKGIREGKSDAEIQASTRRQIIPAALKAIRRLTVGSQSLRNVPRNAIPRLLARAKTVLSKKFSFVVELRGRNRETGELQIGHVTITTNKGNRTRRSLEEQARRFFRQATDKPDPRKVGSGSVKNFKLEDAVLVSGMAA